MWSSSAAKKNVVIGYKYRLAHARRYTSGAIYVTKALISCRTSPRVRRVYFRVNLSCRPRRGDISSIYRIRCTLVKERPLVNGSISNLIRISARYRPRVRTLAVSRRHATSRGKSAYSQFSFGALNGDVRFRSLPDVTREKPRPRRGDISSIYRIRCTLVKERPLVNGSISNLIRISARYRPRVRTLAVSRRHATSRGKSAYS